jgi:hypothetical protein
MLLGSPVTVVFLLIAVVSLSQAVPVASAASFVHHHGHHRHHHVTTICASSTTSSLQAATTTSAAPVVANGGADSSDFTATRDVAIQQLLQRARELGPIGADCTKAEQDELVTMARNVATYSDPQPARVPLRNNSVHHLLYSGSPGGSSGKIFGPFVGKVTQMILDDTNMINAVSCGPLRVELELHRKVVNDNTTLVTFDTTTTFLFGMPLGAPRPLENQSGVWNIHFVGHVTDAVDGRKKLVRVMETPNLFILVSPLG